MTTEKRAAVPFDPDGCVDFVVVRFKAEGLFSRKAVNVEILIDGPDTRYVTVGRGRNRITEEKLYWTEKYVLEFISGLSKETIDADTVRLTADENAVAELWQVDLDRNRIQPSIGQYLMAFEFVARRVP